IYRHYSKDSRDQHFFNFRKVLKLLWNLTRIHVIFHGKFIRHDFFRMTATTLPLYKHYGWTTFITYRTMDMLKLVHFGTKFFQKFSIGATEFSKRIFKPLLRVNVTWTLLRVNVAWALLRVNVAWT